MSISFPGYSFFLFLLAAQSGVQGVDGKSGGQTPPPALTGDRGTGDPGTGDAAIGNEFANADDESEVFDPSRGMFNPLAVSRQQAHVDLRNLPLAVAPPVNDTHVALRSVTLPFPPVYDPNGLAGLEEWLLRSYLTTIGGPPHSGIPQRNHLFPTGDREFGHFFNPGNNNFSAAVPGDYLAGITGPSDHYFAWNTLEAPSATNYSLVPNFAPTAMYDSGWCTLDVQVDNAPQGVSYRRRAVTLSSGGTLIIYTPFDVVDCEDPGVTKVLHETTSSPDPNDEHDAFFWILPYNGGQFDLKKRFERPENCGPCLDQIFERGMTLVIATQSTGHQSILTTMSVVVEAALWMDGLEYIFDTSRELGPGPLNHRKFLAGSSVASFMTMSMAVNMPWMFRGGLALDMNADIRQVFGLGGFTPLMLEQMRGIYDRYGTLDKGFAHDPWLNAQFNELERAPGLENLGDDQGIYPKAVDLGGIGLLASDLGRSAFARLEVPIVISNGDEDIFRTFFKEDLELSSAGYVVEKRIPMAGHGGGNIIENFKQLWYANEDLVGVLLAEADANGALPPPAPATQADFPWESYRVASVEHRSSQFHEKYLQPRRGAPVTASDLSASRVNDSAWRRLNVAEGLAVAGSFVTGDFNGDGELEIFAGTARGELVLMRLRTAQNSNTVRAARIGWRGMPPASSGRFFGCPEVAEVSGKLVALYPFGPLVEFDPSSQQLIVRVNNTAQAGDDRRMGTQLRNLSVVSSKLYFVNEEGELLEVEMNSGAANWNVTQKNHIEGAITGFVPVDGNRAVYASAHGNLKEIDELGQARHPNSLTGISDHLYGTPQLLTELPGSKASYAAWVNSPTSPLGGVPQRLVLFKDINRILGFTELPQPQALIYDDDGNDKVARFVGAWGNSIQGFELDTRGGGGPYETARALEIRTWTPVHLPGPATAIQKAPAGLKAFDPFDTEFDVAWIVTTQAGQVALIGDLFRRRSNDYPPNATPPDANHPHVDQGLALPPARYALFGEPYGSAFGIHKLPSGKGFVAVGPQKKSWAIDRDGVRFGVAADITNQTAHQPHWGIAVAPQPTGFKVFGLHEGGEAFFAPDFGVVLDEAWVVRPNSALDKDAYESLTQSEKLDRIKFGAGVEVVNMETGKPVWWSQQLGGTSNIRLFLEDSTQPPEGRAPLTAGSTSEYGAVARWADMDEDGVQDIVTATRGGRVVWFRNQNGPGASEFTADSFGGLLAPPSGELDYTAAFNVAPDPDLGWTGDLGNRILSMEVIDLGISGGPFIVVGTDQDNHPDFPEHLSESGSVWVLRKQNASNGLQIVASYSAGEHGIFGLRHFQLGGEHNLVVSFARGHFQILGFDPLASPTQRLFLRYESPFVAPLLGAYDSILAFASHPTPGETRLVFGSAGGFFAFDVRRVSVVDPDE